MPVWPPTLPQDPEIGFTVSGPHGGMISKAMDVGPPKRRRRSSAVIKSVPISFAQLTDAQVDTFETFYATTLGQGVLTFTMPDPRDDTVRTRRFSDADPPYSLTPMNRTEYRLSMVLEQMP